MLNSLSCSGKVQLRSHFPFSASALRQQERLTDALLRVVGVCVQVQSIGQITLDSVFRETRRPLLPPNKISLSRDQTEGACGRVPQMSTRGHTSLHCGGGAAQPPPGICPGKSSLVQLWWEWCPFLAEVVRKKCVLPVLFLDRHLDSARPPEIASHPGSPSRPAHSSGTLIFS